jgi:N-acetyl-S-(2-succino)cysteine monooxygenase
MEQWFASRAADGFLLLPPVTPDAITDFVELVIPVLQKRNLFRREYEGLTLRENLGLPRPIQPDRTARNYSRNGEWMLREPKPNVAPLG